MPANIASARPKQIFLPQRFQGLMRKTSDRNFLEDVGPAGIFRAKGSKARRGKISNQWFQGPARQEIFRTNGSKARWERLRAKGTTARRGRFRTDAAKARWERFRTTASIGFGTDGDKFEPMVPRPNGKDFRPIVPRPDAHTKALQKTTKYQPNANTKQILEQMQKK